eukprot:Unigene6417_Nuclearia_a/m.19782 Unigene6417_Nuclearia_a/g.19782  ORF Unigene6417_Nuclearia_a/g.19782 Unigene6417_Nuclearia_a/m.19782 type:complete len:104 (-) Unigene6417_Nuclearia_a:87-398(-)
MRDPLLVAHPGALAAGARRHGAQHASLSDDVATLKEDVRTLKDDVATLKTDMLEVKDAMSAMLRVVDAIAAHLGIGQQPAQDAQQQPAVAPANGHGVHHDDDA